MIYMHYTHKHICIYYSKLKCKYIQFSSLMSRVNVNITLIHIYEVQRKRSHTVTKVTEKTNLPRQRVMTKTISKVINRNYRVKRYLCIIYNIMSNSHECCLERKASLFFVFAYIQYTAIQT